MGRYQPALLAGLFIGVLSGLPVVNVVNVCCCAWVVAGGVLVVYLLQQNSPAPVVTSEAVLQALIAGAIGGAIATVADAVIFKAFSPMMLDTMKSRMDDSQMPPEARAFVERFMSGGNLALITAFIKIPMYAVFSMAGAFLGLAIFRKKTPPQAQTTVQP